MEVPLETTQEIKKACKMPYGQYFTTMHPTTRSPSISIVQWDLSHGVDGSVMWHNGTKKYKHHDVLPQAIVEVVKPIFKKLSDSSLLKRCLHGGTQNQNESFNNLVWLYCPKTGHAERRVIETAVGLAVCHFNNGMSAVERIMQRLGLSPGHILRQMCSQLDKERVWQAGYKSSEKEKKRRKKRRAIKKGFEDKKKLKKKV